VFQDSIQYIIKFLLYGGNEHLENQVSYEEEAEGAKTKICILKSKFFSDAVYGTYSSLPSIPLKEMNGVPILFGGNEVKKIDGKIIVYADLIASTYFLITRYEEIVSKDVRDEHGRFVGKESLPFRAGFIDRPIVDEYGRMLRGWLREVGLNVNEPPKQFGKIYLTHDVDNPWEDFSLKSAVRRVIRLLVKNHKLTIYPLLNLIGIPRYDPWFNFEWLIDQDSIVMKKYHERCKTIYFVKSGGNAKPEDSFIYIKKPGFQSLRNLLRTSKAHIGLHTSYQAGMDSKLLDTEKRTLSSYMGETILFNRHHFLRSRDPQDMEELIDIGITDDFTMGYADIAGFRLGTSRSVKWINPYNSKLTSLTLHPMTVMEGTLFENQYMGLSWDEANEYAQKLIMQVKSNNGELILLWHNTAIAREEACKALYVKLLQYLYMLKC